MRVLFLASFFPKPGNPVMGTWALGQARALARQPIELRVVSFTSQVPRWLAFTPGARAYADCPPEHTWDELKVEYPRWRFYPVRPFKTWAYRDPRRQMRIAWNSAKPELRRIVESWQPDVIYCHHSLPNGYMALQLHQTYGVPYVVTDHDFGEISDCEIYPVRRQVIEPITHHAAMMISVARRMEQATRKLFPTARTTTVYNGIDLPPESVLVAARPSQLQGKLVLFSCGMFAPRKGFELLVEAFARVAGEHPSAVLRIAGDGERRPQIEAAIARSGVGDRVQLLGRLPHAQVIQEMAWSDAFALIGWDEPFATVFIEAMGCGRPIVTASDGGINDVVEHEREALVVRPHDADDAARAMSRLLEDAELRRRMGQAARQLVEHKLTWDANARRMHELFSQSLTRTPE